MTLSEYLTALTNTQSIEELWDMHTRKMNSYGFDRLLYGFTRYRSGKSLGDPEDYVVLTNHSEAYTSIFRVLIYQLPADGIIFELLQLV